MSENEDVENEDEERNDQEDALNPLPDSFDLLVDQKEPVLAPPLPSSTRSSSKQKEPPIDEAARLQRSRERNREHARRTRLRKKAALQELQHKIEQLKATKASLQQQVQEQSIASILLGLHGTEPPPQHAAPTTASTTRTNSPCLSEDHNDEEEEGPESSHSNKRKRSMPATQKPLQVRIAGKGLVTIQSQVNWKTGTYMDEAGMTQQLTPDELEILRYVSCCIDDCY